MHGAERSRAHAPRRRWAIAAMVAAAAYAALDGWSREHLFLINTTESLPNWAFLVDRAATPSRGALVFFAPPVNALIHAHFGAHPAPFGKIVYGVPGDRVERHGSTFLVNGRAVAKAKPLSRRGEPLMPGPTGVLPRGCLFVATPHPDSFDSRYAAVGWICRDRVLGVGKAVL